MTVSSTTTRNSYTGDGTTTVFAYTFKIFDDDDITVILRTTATGTETVQTKTTDYSVSGVGDTGGGNITFVTAPTAAQTVVLLRQTAQTQTTDYTPNDPFPAASHEDALDKLTLIQQDQQDELDRAIKLSRTNTMTSTEFTVGASDRASKVLAFDTSGELSVTQELGTFRGNWSASTAFAERDLIKDTTNNNIYLANTAHTSSGSLPISTNADSSKWDLIVDAAAATTSATNAATSATAAAASATAAAASEAAAATSETNAAASEAGVAADAAAAAASASSASTSATNAATSETNAATSASAASTSASNAATSATSASNSATSASTSASNAATSATNASNSASAASTSASNAATSETNAATSESNAATSASSAASDASAAASSAAAAAASFDAFDDIYLGAKASAPTVDNDGDALTAGDQYFNTTNSTLYVWNGSAWQSASPDIVADITPQLGGNLDLNGNDITGTGDIDITGAVTATSTTGAQFEAEYATNQSFTITQSGGASLLKSRNGASDGEVYLMGGQSGKTRLKATTSGDIEFYNTDGTTKKMGWDATADSLEFADNAKAVFGAGSDLQIYHDGSDSIISDQGTGDLKFEVNRFLVNNSTDTETMILATPNGAVSLYYDSNPKLATTSSGIDVTGTVTADALTVDNGASQTDIQIESDTASNIKMSKSGVDYFRVYVNDTNTQIRNLAATPMYFKTNDTNRALISSAGDVALYASDGTTQGFYWDASTQRLGLGTTAPGTSLDVRGASGTRTISGTTVNLGARLRPNDQGGFDIGSTSSNAYLHNLTDGGATIFSTRSGSTDYTRMTITSGGNVGIGTSSPLGRLHVTNPSGVPAIYFDGANSDIGYASAGVLQFGEYDGSTYTERMRIDGSGNLLVGTTDVNIGTNSGTSVTGAVISDGTAIFGKSGNRALVLNRGTSDGNLAELRKDGTTVSSIGVKTSTPYFVRSTGGGIALVADSLCPADSTGSPRDDFYSLGLSTNRFSDLYLAGGVYLGGTGSANHLDDYEEGTFSPALQAVSASTNSGEANYVKIGQMVFCRGYIAWTGLNTADASGFQFALPFTADISDDNGFGTVAAQFTMNSRHTTGFTGDLPDVHGARVASSSFVLTRLETDFAYNNGVDASGEFHFHFSYRATT